MDSDISLQKAAFFLISGLLFLATITSATATIFYTNDFENASQCTDTYWISGGSNSGSKARSSTQAYNGTYSCANSLAGSGNARYHDMNYDGTVNQYIQFFVRRSDTQNYDVRIAGSGGADLSVIGMQTSSSTTHFSYYIGAGWVASGVQYNTNTWYNITFHYNDPTLEGYVNGNLIFNTSKPGQDFSFAHLFQNGADTAWVDSIKAYNKTAPPPPPPPGNATSFSITAEDEYTNSALTNFSATVNGTGYTTTNGTIITTIDQSKGYVLDMNISSTEGGGYYNRAYNSHDTSSNLTASLHQTELSFNAVNRVTGYTTAETSSATGFWILPANGIDNDNATYARLKAARSGTFLINISYAKGIAYKTNDGTYRANTPNDCYGENVSLQYTSTYDPLGPSYENTLSCKNSTAWHTIQNINPGSNETRLYYMYGGAIGTFTASTSSNGGSNTATGNPPRMNLTAANNYVISFGADDYYNAVLSDISAVALTNTTNQASFKVYDHLLDITITVTEGTVTDQNFSVDIYDNQGWGYHEKTATTNGTVRARLTDGNYTVWLNDSIHTLLNTTVLLNTSSNLTSIDISTLTANAFNITFYNETNNEPLDGKTIYWSLISSAQSLNGTTNTSSVYEQLLTPGNFEIQYWREPTVRRSYYVTLTNQSAEMIRLYLIDDNEMTLYLPVLNDGDYYACSEMTISLLRYYLDINGYRVVEMAKTDTNGQGVLHVEPNEINYKMLFSGSCGTFTTSPQKIVSSTDSFTVTGSTGLLTSSNAIQDATINLSYINSTQTYVFTWADTSNVVTKGCLYVYRHANGTRTTMSSSCSESNIGSLIYTLTGNLTDTQWTAKGQLYTNTEYSTYSFSGPELDFRTSITTLGVTMVFWGLLVVLAIVLATAHSAGAIVFTSIGTVCVLIALGILAGGPGVIAGLVIVGVIVIYKMRTS